MDGIAAGYESSTCLSSEESTLQAVEHEQTRVIEYPPPSMRT